MANNADLDQLASEEANWSGSTLFAKAGYPGSAGQGLIDSNNNLFAMADLSSLLSQGNSSNQKTIILGYFRQFSLFYLENVCHVYH